jgi:RNA polymerase sigma-70 factor (ECF subfamily)
VTTPPLPADLVRRAQAADPEALSAIYERYAPGIYRYVYYRVGDPELARDLQSDVFVRMLESIGSYQERGWPISAWLYRIAYARTIDVLRRSDRRNQLPLEPWDLLSEGPEQDLDQSEERAAVRRAMGRLIDAHRTVITLRFIYGLTLEETGRQLGRSVGSVKSLQHRATERLRTLTLEELGEA